MPLAECHLQPGGLAQPRYRRTPPRCLTAPPAHGLEDLRDQDRRLQVGSRDGDRPPTRGLDRSAARAHDLQAMGRRLTSAHRPPAIGYSRRLRTAAARPSAACLRRAPRRRYRAGRRPALLRRAPSKGPSPRLARPRRPVLWRVSQLLDPEPSIGTAVAEGGARSEPLDRFVVGRVCPGFQVFCSKGATWPSHTRLVR